MWGIIAGSGRLPVLILEGMKKEGITPVIASLDPEISRLVEKGFVLTPSNILSGMMFLRKNGVDRVVIAGIVPKNLIFDRGSINPTVREVVDSLRIKDDHSLLGVVVDFIESAGFKVEEYRYWIRRYIADKGVLSSRKPTDREWSDIDYGYKIAKAIASYSFGQTVVVKNGVVLSVEAIEGTDETIKRAGIYGGSGSVVVKVIKDGQDKRYDLPTIGIETVKSMVTAGATCIAVESEYTIIIDRELVIDAVNESGISLVGI